MHITSFFSFYFFLLVLGLFLLGGNSLVMAGGLLATDSNQKTSISIRETFSVYSVSALGSEIGCPVPIFD